MVCLSGVLASMYLILFYVVGRQCVHQLVFFFCVKVKHAVEDLGPPVGPGGVLNVQKPNPFFPAPPVFFESGRRHECRPGRGGREAWSVSFTHPTLPPRELVEVSVVVV